MPRDGNTSWVSASNVANPRSEKVPADAWWPIAPVTPWPPAIGQRHLLVALSQTPSGVPKRMPGGGKITSPSVFLCWIGWRSGAEPLSDDPIARNDEA